NAVKGIIVALKDPNRKVQSTAIVDVRRGLSMARKITIALIAMLMTVLAGIAYQRSLTLSSPPLDKSIAVLPFADMSPSHDQEYFCDGVAEEIINVLAQVRGLKVIARSSSFQFKGRNEDLKKVGQLLGVSSVLEGSIRKSSEKIRVTAQLINTSDGSHLWSKTFERTASDIFSIQDEIAAAISESLEATLSPSDKEIRERWDEAAWKDYQLGRFYYDRGGVGDEAIARNYFKNSVTKDSTHSISWSYLATLNLLTSTWGEAERSNAIALQLDSSNVEAWVNHAYFSIYREFNHRTATVILQRVMRAEKSAKTLRNINSILNTLGRTREGIPYGLQAIELDPLQPRAFDYLERSYYQLRNFDSANFYYNKLFQISPQFRGTFIMRYKTIYAKIDSYLAQGNWIEAEKLLPQNNEPISLSYWSVTSYMKGDKRASDKYLRELKQIAADEKEFYLTNYFIAIAHCFRKENEDALSALEKSLEKREVMLTGRIKNEPVLDPLRKEPRFIKMVKYLDREDPE
ncbi:MAG TPA: hypothetical protein VG737_03995, partial [Cyclobacteriaceae bacterium]|nr:hypothetical protein [Cyclobacteriaceae bacterium]